MMDSGSLAHRLHLARKAAGLTQEAVADRTGLHWTSISRFECGHQEPSASTLRKLVIALNTSADYLLATRSVTDDEHRSKA